MGDFYSTLVPQKVKKSDIASISEKIIKYLSDNKIIKLNKRENVFSPNQNNMGYEPDINYAKAVHPFWDDNSTLSMEMNGVVIEAGRALFLAPDIETIECPHCNIDISENDNWRDKLAAWENGTEEEVILCENCGEANSIENCTFLPPQTGAFGEIGITFWNWGEFQDSFVEEIEHLIGYKIDIVFGKL